MGAVFLYPEYCDADLFTGWHLYLRDRNDGSPNDDGGWGWVRRSDMASRSLAALFPELPQLTTYEGVEAEIAWHNRFITAFVAKYPKGVLVDRNGYDFAIAASASLERNRPVGQQTESGEQPEDHDE
jgi:hypothetical protein